MTKAEQDLIQQTIEQQREKIKDLPPPSAYERPTIHYTELGEPSRGMINAKEYNVYRRVVGQLLAEGHEGKWVLIKGEEIIGLWNTLEEVREVANQRYFGQPVLMKQILTREPVIRLSSRVRLCPG